MTALLAPRRALLHPAWIGALALLVLNDHALKGAGVLPGWLTGKLSDFAGLFVAGVLLAALARARTARRVAIAQAVVGMGFTAFKLVPILSVAANAIYGLVGLSWVVVTDPTDLLALPTLALAYVLVVRAGAPRVARPGRVGEARPALRAIAARGLLLVGLLACIASEDPGPTATPVEQPLPCGGVGADCDGDGDVFPADCDDTDANVGPGQGCPDPFGESVCDDAIDDDDDGRADCDDDDCSLACADVSAVCDATPVTVIEGSATLTGTTSEGTSVMEGKCIGADAPEVAFVLTPPVDGILTAVVPAGHGLHVRRACEAAYSELACDAGETPGAVLQVQAFAEQPLTIAVEAIDALASGPFELAVALHPLGCGNGVRAGDEECDDGNWAAGDGCDGACRAEPAALCADLPVLATGATQGDFATGSRAFKDTCAGSFDTLERVYSYVATTTTLTVSVASAADVSLYARGGACPGAEAAGCVEKNGAGGGESLTLSTTPGETFLFFVELRAGQPEDATFTLTLSDP